MYRNGFTVVALLFANLAGAAENVPPRLTAYPASIHLIGANTRQQLAISGHADLKTQEATEAVGFQSSDVRVATVSKEGLVQPTGNGKATITATWTGAQAPSVAVPVTVTAFDLAGPISFPVQVVPILTKFSCNAGGCHGKQHGQNGFKLSLFGFDPEADHDALVKEARGRRLFFASPENSLLLVKATAGVAHGGGRRLGRESFEYNLLLRWVRQSAPYETGQARKLVGLDVWPRERLMTIRAAQRLIVTARYQDGATEDVTRLAQYQSNDGDCATVDEAGVVRTLDVPGETAIMVRYQGQVGIFPVMVPLGRAVENYPDFPADNFIDTLAVAKWKKLGIVPSDLCTDAEFIRRATLDLCGTLPTPDETRRFLSDAAKDKRAHLIDRLLDRPEYADYFATKWADILHNRRQGVETYKHGTYLFHGWIRQALMQNMPYDEFVRAIVAGSGGYDRHPPVVWFRLVRSLDGYVENTGQLFLGLRLQCAQCHHHPAEKWGQEDYYGLAAFFSRVGRKVVLPTACFPNTREDIYDTRAGEVIHPRTGQVMKPKGLDGPVYAESSAVDPRHQLVDWMARPDNPYFAKALVNRLWGHCFNRGLVDPLDDMRSTNPPINPELLDALAKDFIAHKFDVKHVLRTICTSRVYSLSSTPNVWNAHDRKNFARYYPKRLPAEVLLDAVAQATGVPSAFPGLPTGTRAIQLPDESVASAFLDIFGRPQRSTPCECERINDATLSQSLHLLNSRDLQNRLLAANGRAARLATDARPHKEKVEDLFLWAQGRLPSAAEATRAERYVNEHQDKAKAYQNLLWALINAKEFQFNY